MNRHLQEQSVAFCRRLLWAWPLLLVGFSHAAWAHPFHISTAEMEFNPKTQRFEVSLKLHSIDFEQVLSNQAGKQINLEEGDHSEMIQRYLDQHFVLVALQQLSKDERQSEPKPDQEVWRSKAKLVGTEFEASWLWLYFELKPPSCKEELALVNSVLVDFTEGQINTVSVRHQGERAGLKMHAKQRWEEFSRSWLSGTPPE